MAAGDGQGEEPVGARGSVMLEVVGDDGLSLSSAGNAKRIAAPVADQGVVVGIVLVEEHVGLGSAATEALGTFGESGERIEGGLRLGFLFGPPAMDEWNGRGGVVCIYVEWIKTRRGAGGSAAFFGHQRAFKRHD